MGLSSGRRIRNDPTNLAGPIRMNGSCAGTIKSLVPEPSGGNDPREWRITHGDLSIVLKTRWGNNPEDWMLRSDQYGAF